MVRDHTTPEESVYVSPLASRNASPEMLRIWSPQFKHSTWRRLWLALAESQHELGLAQVTRGQIDELRQHLDDIDFEKASEYERRFRHDVVAHIHALGDVAPHARPIIHLGATSQYVNCNTELIQLRDSMNLILAKLANAIDAIARFAEQYRRLPTLGFTHYQPAQPTTVGKRASVWAYDFVLALEELEWRVGEIRLRGAKGTTGTQASFLELFDNEHERVERLDQLVAEKMGFAADQRYIVTGQTYPRIVDAQILQSLASTASAVHRMCNDLRLLANRKEIEEPFTAEQVGSSAMPYKRNPMRCERATGLARFVMSLTSNALNTAATQWFERTLDDSANRRLSLPESFLALDGALDLVHLIADGLVVYEATIAKNLKSELPFMASENLLMAAVQKGADRQEAHEVIRKHAQEAGFAVKNEGRDNDLLDRLRGEPMFAGIDFDSVLNPSDYVGRAPEQVDAFIQRVIIPIRQRYADKLTGARDPGV
jgi:adenylosuccinate lyase